MKPGRPIVLHPVLFAALPVLHLFSANVQETETGDVLLPLAVVIGVAAGAWLGLTPVLRDARRSALAVTALVLLVFSYGSVHRLLRKVEVLGFQPGRHRVLLTLWALLAVAGVVAAIRARRLAPRVTPVLNVVAVGLVVFNIVGLLGHGIRSGGGGDVQHDVLPVRPAVAGPAVGKRPDVFYIVFDRYGGRDALLREFGFDNTPFLEALEERGFFVAGDSRANYPKTLLSLASTLNMDYLDFLAAEGAGGDAAPARALIRRHAVGRFFVSQGYRYVHVGSWWGPTAKSPIAHRSIRYGGLSEFSTALFETTAFAPIGTLLSEDLDERKREYNRVAFQFEQLEGLAGGGPEPVFVFAHVLSPHEPFVFDRDGSFVTLREERARSEGDGYVRQLQHINGRILDLVDALLASPESPIIILQSDEGPLGSISSWEGAAAPTLARKFPILNAYHLPGLEDAALTPSISPVNSFRVVLNGYFGTDLALLPDRSYVFRRAEDLYVFQDVTARVKGA
jgi:hypothetical protein